MQGLLLVLLGCRRCLLLAHGAGFAAVGALLGFAAGLHGLTAFFAGKDCHDLPPDQIETPGNAALRPGGPQTNDHYLTVTTKDEKWLVLVGRPALAASPWQARRPAPPSYFHVKMQPNGGTGFQPV